MSTIELLNKTQEELKRLSAIDPLQRTQDEESKMAQAVTEAGKLRAQLAAEDEVKASEQFLRSPQTKHAFDGGQDDSRGSVEVELPNRKAFSGPADSTKEVMLRTFGEKVVSDISTSTYKSAHEKYLRKGLHGLESSEIKDLQVGVDTLGGFLAPAEYIARIIEKKPAPTNVLGRITTIPIGRDAAHFPSVPWTTDDLYTNAIRTTQTGEVPASATTALATDPTFGTVKVEAFTRMVYLNLSRDLLEDSVFDVQSWVSNKMAEAMNLILESLVCTGTGIGQPTGIFTAPGSTIAGNPMPAVWATGSTLSTIKLQQMPYLIPEQYEDEELVWVMNKTRSMRHIAGLQDSTGRPLFGYGFADNGIASARPRELLGYPIVRSAFAPDLVDAGGTEVANAYALAFGSLKSYYAVERTGFTLDVLRETRATLNQVQVVGRKRWGGMPVEHWAMKVNQNA